MDHYFLLKSCLKNDKSYVNKDFENDCHKDQHQLLKLI